MSNNSDWPPPTGWIIMTLLMDPLRYQPKYYDRDRSDFTELGPIFKSKEEAQSWIVVQEKSE